MSEFNEREHLLEVGTFFDHLGVRYGTMISSPDKWLGFPYEARLRSACRLLEEHHCRVLDIGAGSGAFYRSIIQNGFRGTYSACDLSGVLLEQHPAESNKKWQGDLFSSPFVSEKWDAIVMLGVTPYLSPDARGRYMEFLSTHVSARGIITVSFAHKNYIFNRLRTLIKGIIPKSWLGNKTLALSFNTCRYTEKEAIQLFANSGMDAHIKWIWSKGISKGWGKYWSPEFLLYVKTGERESEREQL